jgi:hypothetical protein
MLVFMGCEVFMESLSRCDSSSISRTETDKPHSYTLQRCCTSPTNILGLTALCHFSMAYEASTKYIRIMMSPPLRPRNHPFVVSFGVRPMLIVIHSKILQSSPVAQYGDVTGSRPLISSLDHNPT